MDIREFLKIKFDGTYFDGDDFKQEKAKLNIVEETNIDYQIDKIKYINKNNEVRYLIVEFGGMGDECGADVTKLEQDIKNEEVKDFIYYKNEIRHMEMHGQAKEEALKTIENRRRRALSLDLERKLYEDLEQFINKKYNEEEIKNTLSKHNYTIEKNEDTKKGCKVFTCLDSLNLKKHIYVTIEDDMITEF